MDNYKTGVTFQSLDHTKARLTVTEPVDIEAMRRDGNWTEVVDGEPLTAKPEERPEWMFPIRTAEQSFAKKRGRPVKGNR